MRIAIAGATGLVGQAVITELLPKAPPWHVEVVGRRNLWPLSASLSFYETDFKSLPEVSSPLDAALCCLGTTLKKAGSKAAFFQVDHDFSLQFASWAKKRGAKQFALISSLGANPESRFFYSKVKGQLEAKIKELGFQTLVIYRPSLLIGHRSEKRALEGLAQSLYQLLPPSSWQAWLGTPVSTLAKKITSHLEKPPKEPFIICPALELGAHD